MAEMDMLMQKFGRVIVGSIFVWQCFFRSLGRLPLTPKQSFLHSASFSFIVHFFRTHNEHEVVVQGILRGGERVRINARLLRFGSVS